MRPEQDVSKNGHSNVNRNSFKLETTQTPINRMY